MPVNTRILGSRIRELRNKEQMTQETLAELANSSRVYIGMLEKGIKMPSLDMLVAIANALHTSADVILAGNLDFFESDTPILVMELLQDCSHEEFSILFDNMKCLKAILKDYRIK